MCLYVDFIETEKFKKENFHRKFIKIKKMLCFDEHKIIRTPHQLKKVFGGWLTPSLQIDTIIKPYIGVDACEIHGGAIHCYRYGMNKHIFHFPTEFTINAFALIKDFIAAGTNEDLAFKKIYIPKVIIKKKLEELNAS